MNTLELVDFKSIRKTANRGLHCVIIGSAVGDSEFIPLETLNQASAAFRAFCDENGFSARDAGDCQIWNGSKPVAHVSYNGNIWQGCYPYDEGDLLFNNTGLVWDGKRWDIAREAVCAS